LDDQKQEVARADESPLGQFIQLSHQSEMKLIFEQLALPFKRAALLWVEQAFQFLDLKQSLDVDAELCES
jgi:hypothetical protein